MSIPRPQKKDLSRENCAQAAAGSLSPKRSHKLFFTRIKFILRLSCTLLLLTFLFRSFSWPSVLQKLQHLDDGEVVIGVIIGLIGVMLSSYQWQSLLEGESIHIDLKRLINLYLVGIAFNHFLPTGMEVM
ncbi:lysylphosphatidylglycerol synthase domain-containing protein [Dictyobacter vulcani]|uniref:lysylphosphatidylglycerol synthase domain-containing protein n=1 Tax=Dictyobacter vulcani TaxID=2607529 RepID=UPI001386FE28|nr:lysylphosphatidylglycerol synthase domain-containing protein [Dictyobacter vulcani]